MIKIFNKFKTQKNIKNTKNQNIYNVLIMYLGMYFFKKTT